MTRKVGSGVFNRNKESETRPSNGVIPKDHNPKNCSECYILIDFCSKGRRRSRRRMKPSKDLCYAAAKKRKKKILLAAGSSC